MALYFPKDKTHQYRTQKIKFNKMATSVVLIAAIL